MFLKSMISGYAISDLREKEYNDKKFYEIGVGIGQDEEGNNLPIVNISIWGRKVEVSKGDRVFACGKLRITTKEDKTYYSLTADYISREKSLKLEEKEPELTPVDDDSLPF